METFSSLQVLPVVANRFRQGPPTPIRRQSIGTDGVYSVADKTLSGPPITPSLTDKTLSIPNKTMCVTDITFSVTDKTFSVRFKTVSVVDRLLSVVNKTLSLPETPLFVTHKSLSLSLMHRSPAALPASTRPLGTADRPIPLSGLSVGSSESS